MAIFKKKKTVKVDTTVDTDVELSISVEEFYNEMSNSEDVEMKELLIDIDLDVSRIMDDVGDKYKFYKDLAYHIGTTDSEHLDALITELKYWSKK